MKNYLAGLLLMSMSPLAFSAVTDCSVTACRYVRSGASGSGSSWSDASGSLPSTLVRGTTYFIADGTYAGRTFNTAVSGTTPITIKKAIAADHGSNTGWTADMGDGQASFTGGLEFTTSNWVIEGQTGGGAENNFAGNFGFKVTETSDAKALLRIAYSGTADNITIRHVDLQGKGSVSSNGGSYSNDAMAVYGASNVTLSYYRMRGIGRAPFFLSAKNFTAEHGHVESFYGSSAVHSEVASIWGFDGSVGDHTFRYNLITDVQSTGGIMWDNSSNTSAKLLVYGNVFYRPAGKTWGEANGVIGGWTGGGGEQFHNAKVYNNTFINVDQASLSSNPNIYSNNEAYNNIFYNSEAPNFSRFGAHDYNLFINSGGNPSEPNGKTGTTNPFVNFTGLDFRLSAATAGGRVLGAPFNVDPLGKPRGSDGVFDRGAFEFGVGTTTPTPTTLVAPTNLRTTSTASNSVQLQFDYSGSGQTGFAINRKTGTAGTYAQVGTSSSQGYTDGSVLASTQYCYQAFAYNDSTKSPASNELCVTTPASTVVTPTPTTGESLLSSLTPAQMNNNDGVNYELGMKFKAMTAGKITAIRFYKSSQESGTHTGKIYSSTGSLLASVTFANETASGWQQQNLATPLNVAANTVYVVSVNTGNRYYVTTVGGLSSAVSSTNLQTVAGSNGVFGPVGSMPTSSWNGSNYFRDVVFTPGTTTTTGDTTAPKVTFSIPVNNSIVGVNTDVTLTANATDDVGVAKVEFYVNGALKCTDTTAPYNCSWIVPSTRNVFYDVTAKAYDAKGNVGSVTSRVESR